jgi:hypothetical protein
MSQTQQSVDQIGVKFDAVLSHGLTLERRFTSFVSRVRASLDAGKYPESKRAAVELRVCEYIDEVSHSDVCARGNVDLFVTLTDRCARDLMALEQPIPVLTEKEKWVAIVSREWRGDGPELDELFAVLKPDEQILAVDWQAATVALPNGERRIITRQSLRLRSRPSYSHKSPEQWIANWSPIENPHDDAPEMGRVVFSERIG